MEIAGKGSEAYQIFFRSSSDAVIICSPLTESILDCSDETLRILRYTREELLEHGMRRLFRERSAQLCQMVEIPGSTAEPESDAMVLLDGTGAERRMSVVCRLLDPENGSIISVTLRDIAEVSVVNCSPDFASITREELVDAAPLFATGKVQGSLIHEINNSNNVILMNVSLLKELWNEWSPLLAGIPADDAELESKSIPLGQVLDALPKLLDGIRDGSERVRTVTGVARDLSTSSVYRSDGLDVNVAVKNCILLLTSTFHRRAKKLVVTLAEDLPVVQGNRSEVMAVVISQALRMLEPDGDALTSLCITTERAGEEHVVIGMSAARKGIRENEELQPASSSRSSAAQSSGLSSLLVDAVVGSYGGKVEYRYCGGDPRIGSISLYWPVMPSSSL